MMFNTRLSLMAICIPQVSEAGTFLISSRFDNASATRVTFRIHHYYMMHFPRFWTFELL
jgi:hypothetical protein